MILEHVILNIVPGKEVEFEKDFEAVTEFISAMPGL